MTTATATLSAWSLPQMGQYRVNGIVRNMDEWYDAFGVKQEDALYLPPGERVEIW